jgi:hypothetical protein
MAKNPAFPFYANDYLVDTLRWSRGMKSLHVDLLCESWANSKLKDIDGCPEGLAGEDRKLWTKIVHKWKLVDGFWINEKLEKCRFEREKFIERQSKAGKKSAAAKKEAQPMSQPETNHGSTTVQPLEGEEEDKVLIIKKEPNEISGNGFAYELAKVEKKLDDLEDRISLALDEIYIDGMRGKWSHVEFDIELMAFKEKVRGSPEDYKDHDTGGIRKAFIYQLRYAKKKSNDRTTNKGTSTAAGSVIEGGKAFGKLRSNNSGR